MVPMSLEAMGFSKRGEGPNDAKMGKFDLTGDIPVGTFGGLKGRGNPIGATGVYQLAEAYLQLKGAAGSNQIPDAEVGLTHNLGGIDTTAAVHVLRRV